MSSKSAAKKPAAKRNVPVKAIKVAKPAKAAPPKKSLVLKASKKAAPPKKSAVKPASKSAPKVAAKISAKPVAQPSLKSVPLSAARVAPARAPIVEHGLVARKPAPIATPPARALPARQQPQLARSYYWSELRAGEDLPHLTMPAIDRVQIARYAGAANDFNRLHLDEPFAQSLGFHSTFAPGSLAMGFVAQLITNWLKRGQLRRLSAKFVKFVRPGDQLTCRGRITELRRESGLCLADLDVWAENQRGEMVLRALATCELLEAPSRAARSGSVATPARGFVPNKIAPRRR